MNHHFYSKPYTYNVINKKTWELWKKEYPEYKDVDFEKFKRYFRIFRDLFVEEMFSNPLGIEVPKLGTFCLTVLDIDFKCAEDFNKTLRPYGNKKDWWKDKFITVENPKRIKVTWKKPKNAMSNLKLLGMQMTDSMRVSYGKLIKEMSVNSVGKARGISAIPSKCKEPENISIFDLI